MERTIDILLIITILVGLTESVILTFVLVTILKRMRKQDQDRESSARNTAEALRSSVHTELLVRLDTLNRIMLDYPDAITKLFSGYEEMTADEVRQYCYVYSVLDSLNYLVLHAETVDPYVRDHLKNLAMLLFIEPKMQAIFLESKNDQSKALLEYLEKEILPLVGGVGRDRQSNPEIDGQ